MSILESDWYGLKRKKEMGDVDSPYGTLKEELFELIIQQRMT